MTTYKVTGGTKLQGTVELAGAKNAGFKAIIASLLGDSPSQICGLGLTSEIELAKQVISSLGGTVSSLVDRHCLTVDPAKISRFEISPEVGGKSRSSTMYIGPLLKKFKRAVVPVPGGDVNIGKRPIDRHIEGLTALGAKVSFENNVYTVDAPNGLTGTTYEFAKNTHTGTETLLMCAAFAKGETILKNAAAEPEVDDLITLLNAMGARIMRLDARTIQILGVEHFRGVRHSVMKDRIEAATFAALAIASLGKVKVIGANPLVLTAFLEKLNEAGGRWEKTDDGITFWSESSLSPTNVETAVYPGFMTDWQPMWSVLMTQSDGVSEIHETVHNSRFDFASNIKAMGGKIDLFSPAVSNPDKTYNFNLTDSDKGSAHAIRVYGKTPLMGGEIEIQDIRQGATILLAGIIAKGVTVIKDPKDQITRGYEDLVGKLTNLGAQIDVVYN